MKYKSTENLPDLLRKINKNELIDYESIEGYNVKEKDPLYNRVNIEKINYIKEHNNELTLKMRIYIYYKYIKAKIFRNTRYDHIIQRPNEHLREPLYNFYDYDYGWNNFSVYLLIIGFTYLIGYFYARFKYDIYMRRIMYVDYTSFILAFEAFDYYVTRLMKKIDYYFPLEMSESEYEFVIYKKIKSYFQKRRLKKEVDMIINTDKEVLELDKVMKYIK